MELVELSRENLKETNKKLYEKIVNYYDYDLVVFVAKGAYLIGKDISEFKNVPLIEIFATRKGGKIKKILKPFLQLIPNEILKKIREKEFNSNYHQKKVERKIKFDEKIWGKYINSEKVLIVDDSVDTGNSIKLVKNEVEKYFKNSEIKVAALNCFNKSKSVVNTDYYLFEDCMLKGPWSSDSKENGNYIKEYKDWHGKQD